MQTWPNVSERADQKRRSVDLLAFKPFFVWLVGSWGHPQGPNFPSPWATILALRLDCSTTALTTHHKVLPIWKLVELKMLDFSDGTRTGISIWTSAADSIQTLLPHNFRAIICRSTFSELHEISRLMDLKLEFWGTLYRPFLFCSETIDALLQDPAISSNTARLGAIFRDDIVSPLDKAVYYTEHLAKYKNAPHFKSPAKNVNWVQHALLDVLCMILGTVVFALGLTFWLLRGACKILCGGRRRGREDRKQKIR